MVAQVIFIRMTDLNTTTDSAIDMGFPLITNVATLFSISHLFGTSKKRCGIYLLKFTDELFYIGQAMDVVRRFSQHRRNYDDIQGFSFIPVVKDSLNEIEKALIFDAESLGFKLKNAVHVSSILGDTDFDLLMSASEQDAWLSATSPLATGENQPKITLPESQQVRFSKNFDQFNEHPSSQSALLLLRQYIKASVPVPRISEYSFWSVSCMPSTNINTWPRLFCVNAAMMELFVVGWVKKTNLLWSFITVDEDVLCSYWPSPDDFKKNFPNVEFLSGGYRDAGQNQITLRCSNFASMDRLLSDVGVCKAAAAMNIRVMRKRANMYMKFHCVQLANQVFIESANT